jgi:hypothetical protein
VGTGVLKCRGRVNGKFRVCGCTRARIGDGGGILLCMCVYGGPKRQYRINTLRFVISQKSADFICIEAEA